MAEHYSKSTVEATVWCKPCGKPTPHNVHDGRRGGCKTCIARLEAEAQLPKAVLAAKQESLF